MNFSVSGETPNPINTLEFYVSYNGSHVIYNWPSINYTIIDQDIDAYKEINATISQTLTLQDTYIRMDIDSWT